MARPEVVAAAFDEFASAQAAAHELCCSGFSYAQVRIASNPANSDWHASPVVGRRTHTLPGVLRRCFSSLFEFETHRCERRSRIEDIRLGDVVVAVTIGSRDEQEIARAAFHRHRAVMLGRTAALSDERAA